MAGILIIAHAPLATALKAAAAHAFPEAAARVEALDVSAQWTPDEAEARARDLLEQALARADRREVLILSDVFGATPSNIAQRLTNGNNVKLVTGANVPMVWRAINYAAEPIEQLVARALAGATQGVMQIASAKPLNQTQPVGPRPGHDHDAHQHQQ